MNLKRRRTAWSLLFVVLPSVAVISSAGVILLPTLGDSAAASARVEDARARVEESHRIAKELASLAAVGPAALSALRAWEESRIPPGETDRHRFEFIREVEEMSGATIKTCRFGLPRPLGSRADDAASADALPDDSMMSGMEAPAPSFGEPTDDGRGVVPTAPISNYSGIAIDLVAQGDLDEVLDLLEFIQFGPRLFTMEGMQIRLQRNDVVEIELSVTAVVLTDHAVVR